MAIDQTARKPAPESSAHFRAAPHNIEAEQALLGALLVNNEAFDRVSDFLKPEHFFEQIHAKIYELTAAGRTQLKADLSQWEQYVRSMGYVLNADLAGQS